MLRHSREGARPADPCTLAIFGASGDLTQRLLMPALYHLASAGLLPDDFAVVGVARAPMSDAQFRAHIGGALRKFAGAKLDPATREWLLGRLSYLRGDFDEAETFDRLGAALARRDRAGRSNALFYLATPPTLFAPLAEQIGRAGLAKPAHGAWSRLIVEKPFGADLESARELNRRIRAVFAEDQTYRIDHFLGKETVQNILALRFANNLFESLWNRDRIDSVQITVAEAVDVAGRGRFYDATGALRDMVPNHLFQLLSLIGMEPPACFAADAVRAEKTKVLQAVRAYDRAAPFTCGVRGQYRAGKIDGKAVVAYRRAPDVARTSPTETYVALKLLIDTWRWAGVPFYLRTGKALKARRTEIAIKFREAPLAIFRDTPVDRLAQNFVIIGIAPEEGISLEFNAKVPGPHIYLRGVDMDFRYKDYFAAEPNTGYETLIYDCMIGDQILFQHAEDVEAAWRVVQPFLDCWRRDRAKGLDFYPAGSDGPKAAEQLLARDHRQWRPIAPEPAP
ncbi:MAG: glucose-6-phosphate dehydrogenase [Alphaproteobacteria bacterium]|nr:glucose-6-phosphate dehydrogenase [Alphaproteobacteria bacterium]